MIYQRIVRFVPVGISSVGEIPTHEIGSRSARDFRRVAHDPDGLHTIDHMLQYMAVDHPYSAGQKIKSQYWVSIENFKTSYRKCCAYPGSLTLRRHALQP